MIPFAAKARCHFDCVATRYELSCVAANENYIRYENREVFLRVSFDNGRSYEIFVEIGQRKTLHGVEHPFSLAEILRLKNVPEATFVSCIMTSEETQLAKMLRLLSDLTLKYLDDFLVGSELSFMRVAELRENESDAYEIERKLRSARGKADTAWRAKNYSAVVAALEPVKSHLSPAEAKRLEYSRKKRNP